MTLEISYYAILREQAGKNREQWKTDASTPSAVYDELRAHYDFSLEKNQLKVAVNNEFVDFETPLSEGDQLVFIPPVWVMAAAEHRKEAFLACEYIIDEIKGRVPIWKKEHYVDGEAFWVRCDRCAEHDHSHDH